MINSDLHKLIGRKKPLFLKDLEYYKKELLELVNENSFLVIGGAGSIGQAVTKEIFKRNPNKLHVVDINENTMVELVRDVRSSYGYIKGEFKTYILDCGDKEFKTFFLNEGPYDFIFNLSAMKHVRSERNPFSLLRMIKTNVLNTIETIKIAKTFKAKKYFCVSTDKATNPENMLGATKRTMELYLKLLSKDISISTARFANVAFSDGSLLQGFKNRIEKKQPISAPKDIMRYFVTPQEAGELCLMSCLLGKNNDIFFPKLDKDLDLISFPMIAKSLIKSMGYNPIECKSEDEARKKTKILINKGDWPCYFFKSDTTGEKLVEEFYTKKEKIDFNRFQDIGIIKNDISPKKKDLKKFILKCEKLQNKKILKKEQLISLFKDILPDFYHIEKGKDLDQRM